MSGISASLIKDLREKTSAGMMDCKRALEETKGDFEAAVDWLRKKGLSAAAKKAGRVAAEGLVGIFSKGNSGAVVEVNSETDFVAKNAIFQDFAQTVAGLQAELKGDLETLKSAKYPEGEGSVADKLASLIGQIGENMSLRRVANLEVKQGFVASYMHNSIAPGLGKIGVLVALESSAAQDKLEAVGKQIAMHVAATNPKSLDTASLDPMEIERERNVLLEQAKASGKAQEIAEKMVEGRIRKFYEEVVLLEQAFIINPDKRVKDVIADAAKDAGAEIKITGFVRFGLGEGIEKEKENLAEEVAKQLAAG